MRSICLAALLLLAAACGGGADDDRSTATDSAAAPPPVSQAPAPADPSTESDTTWALRPDGIGPLRVGMTVPEAAAALGGDFRQRTPDGSEPITNESCDYAQTGRLPRGVTAMIENGRVVRVEVVDSASPVTTAEGARIGDTEERVRQLYPGRVAVGPHKYDENGHYLTVRPAAPADTTHLIVFETDGRVVTRFRGGQKPQVEYVEGCA